MATENPYDRRRRNRGAGNDATTGDMTPLTEMQHAEVHLPRHLAIEDLDAMAFSAHARGRHEATMRLIQEHHDHLVTARREAWDEGHQAGEYDLLAVIQDEYGERVRGMLLAGNERIRIAEELSRGEMDDAAVQALVQVVRGMTGLLADLIDAHHAAFKARPY